MLLFLQQQDEGDEQGASLLLNYPPLAYLNNILVLACNALRECPMRDIANSSYVILATLVTNVCRYIVHHSQSIDVRGQRHITELNTKCMRRHLQIAIPASSMSSDALPLRMSEVLAQLLCSMLAPQIDAMFCAIYGSTTTSADLETVCRDIFVEGNVLSPKSLAANVPTEELAQPQTVPLTFPVVPASPTSNISKPDEEATDFQGRVEPDVEL